MNRTVIITGASRGLGLSLSKKFIEAGDIVFGVSRTTRHWSLARKAVSAADRFYLEKTDLTSETQVRALIHQVEKKFSNSIDILINNAGYGGALSRVEGLSLEKLQKHFSNNLVSAFLMCKYTLPIFLRQKKGWMINISSMAGIRAVPRLFAYSAAKHGVVALTQCIAKENPDAGFKCVTICPGGIHTKMRSDLFGEEDAAKQQSPDFVAGVVFQVAENQIPVDSGSQMMIRHGKIAGVQPLPAA